VLLILHKLPTIILPNHKTIKGTTMNNGIKLDHNKVIINLIRLKDIAISEIEHHLKTIVYNNNIDVFYVIADKYDNEMYEFYFFKKFIEFLKSKFNTFLMLKTKYFPSTKYFDSIFALGVDALTLSINNNDKASKQFNDTINYITDLWPSGTVFTDLATDRCSNDEIKDKIGFYSKLKVIPKISMEKNCSTKGTTFCFRDFIIEKLKENKVSIKWVMNFELCNIIQKQAGQKGRSKRKIAGKFAFELASLRRKLMVKEVQSSFDSASL
jgi:hypothetical protein